MLHVNRLTKLFVQSKYYIIHYILLASEVCNHREEDQTSGIRWLTKTCPMFSETKGGSRVTVQC